jgi:hypothetical protein
MFVLRPSHEEEDAMITRTVHLFNVPIRVRPGEAVRHAVSFTGAAASFAVTSNPPGTVLLTGQDGPGGWSPDPLNPNPRHAIAMAFVQALTYRWQVFHVDTQGNATLQVDISYAGAAADQTNDSVPIVG